MSISRHIIDDFHSIFYHLDDDECDEEIPVWRRQAATTLSCRDAKRENSWWVELVRQDTLLGNLFQYEQIFEYFCIQAAVSAVRKDTRCLGKARIHCSRIIWDPGKYAVRNSLSMLLELGLTVRETYASQLPKDLKDIIRIIVFCLFGPCLDFPYMGILCFVLTYRHILRWLFSSISSIKHIAMHWTMYCAMSFRLHNFQSIVHTFKTINYDKVVRSVMNEILVIYCNSSI